MTDLFPKVTLHYLKIGDKGILGLGENVKLLLEDAGIEHEYIQYTDDEWKPKKQQLLQEGYYFGTVPMLEIEGKKIGKTVPIMRYIAKRLGKYQGSNDEEYQWLDALADTMLDWVKLCSFAMYHGTEERKKRHREVITPGYLDIYEKAYAERNGPYLLGQEISYVDFFMYHRISEEGADYKPYPHIEAFMNAFNERPNIKGYLAKINS
ncbi:hypothetical protein EC973_008242 [Apophysomyces ossiformis]|uniref:Glutathione S-transferase n=1 Tax=Apophysomyces ossiformis TaxID=679940 RepID=A0A8H7EUA9_9FUNG|nr:hypothetical protein EC973_008242 [Apophysomyces ossiformis]